jgi:hypothetical protein
LLDLFETIRTLVISGKYVVSQHAAERLDERGMLEWQVVDGITRGSLMAEHPNAEPSPVVEVRQVLADGTEVKAVWAYLVAANVAKLVTVYFLDR